MRMYPSKVLEITNSIGWETIDHQENICMLSFRDDAKYNVKTKDVEKVEFIHTRINIYYSTMTVGIFLNHPTKGKVKKYFKKVSEDDLIELLQDVDKHIKHEKNYNHE